VGDLLTRVAQRCREAGLHLILGAPRPAATVIRGLLKANCSVRPITKVCSAEDARAAAGVGGTGAEKLFGWGDFVAICSGQITGFQAAYVPVKECPSVFEGLRR